MATAYGLQSTKCCMMLVISSALRMDQSTIPSVLLRRFSALTYHGASNDLIWSIEARVTTEFEAGCGA